MLSRPRNYCYSTGWLEEDASRYDPRQVCVSGLILSQQGSKDVGKLPVHAYNLLLLSRRINMTHTAFIPDSVTWEWSRPSGSEAQVGRLKGPKPVTYTMICCGAPLMTGTYTNKTSLPTDVERVLQHLTHLGG